MPRAKRQRSTRVIHACESDGVFAERPAVAVAAAAEAEAEAVAVAATASDAATAPGASVMYPNLAGFVALGVYGLRTAEVFDDDPVSRLLAFRPRRLVLPGTGLVVSWSGDTLDEVEVAVATKSGASVTSVARWNLYTDKLGFLDERWDAWARLRCRCDCVAVFDEVRLSPATCPTCVCDPKCLTSVLQRHGAKQPRCLVTGHVLMHTSERRWGVHRSAFLGVLEPTLAQFALVRNCLREDFFFRRAMPSRRVEQ